MGEGTGETHRVHRWRVGRTSTRQAGRSGGSGFAPEQPDAAQRAIGQTLTGIAVRSVDDEPGTQRGLRIRGFLGFGGVEVQRGTARQHRPTLDEDQLRGHGDEGADVGQPVRFERCESIEIGVGETAQRHAQDVELARFDQREEKGQRSVELGDLDHGRGFRPAAGTKLDGRDGRGCGRHHGDPGGTEGGCHQFASSACLRSRPA